MKTPREIRAMFEDFSHNGGAQYHSNAPKQYTTKEQTTMIKKYRVVHSNGQVLDTFDSMPEAIYFRTEAAGEDSYVQAFDAEPPRVREPYERYASGSFLRYRVRRSGDGKILGAFVCQELANLFFNTLERERGNGYATITVDDSTSRPACRI